MNSRHYYTDRNPKLRSISGTINPMRPVGAIVITSISSMPNISSLITSSDHLNATRELVPITPINPCYNNDSTQYNDDNDDSDDSTEYSSYSDDSDDDIIDYIDDRPEILNDRPVNYINDRPEILNDRPVNYINDRQVSGYIKRSINKRVDQSRRVNDNMIFNNDLNIDKYNDAFDKYQRYTSYLHDMDKHSGDLYNRDNHSRYNMDDINRNGCKRFKRSVTNDSNRMRR